jgi:hypothetical protein
MIRRWFSLLASRLIDHEFLQGLREQENIAREKERMIRTETALGALACPWTRTSDDLSRALDYLVGDDDDE